MSYREPARTYLSSLVLLALIFAGFLVDLLVIGGGSSHALAWGIGAVVVVGFDALIVHAARSLRSIEVTDEELRVGEETLARAEILGTRLGQADESAILGRRPGEGLPRGTAPLTLQLTGDRLITVASRSPDRLAHALGASEVLPEIRACQDDECDLLQEIDERADALFRVAGMALPAIPFPVDDLRESVRVLVAGRPPVGFARIDEVDGVAHLQELAVLPGQMRRGIGTALLDAACEWARGAGYDAITLTTFAEVAWNAPFYTARGFLELRELTPGLAELRDWELDIGLDACGRRIAMRRELTPAREPREAASGDLLDPASG